MKDPPPPSPLEPWVCAEKHCGWEGGDLDAEADDLFGSIEKI